MDYANTKLCELGAFLSSRTKGESVKNIMIMRSGRSSCYKMKYADIPTHRAVF